MKKELKEIFNEILNLGMTLRQDQLKGYCNKSGNEMLEEYLKENEQRISKILENGIEEELKVGDKVTFTTECEEHYDLQEGSIGKIVGNFFGNKNFYYLTIENTFDEEFEHLFKREYLIKL